jgi:hypothetical protein
MACRRYWPSGLPVHAERVDDGGAFNVPITREGQFRPCAPALAFHFHSSAAIGSFDGDSKIGRRRRRSGHAPREAEASDEQQHQGDRSHIQPPIAERSQDGRIRLKPDATYCEYLRALRSPRLRSSVVRQSPIPKPQARIPNPESPSPCRVSASRTPAATAASAPTRSVW